MVDQKNYTDKFYRAFADRKTLKPDDGYDNYDRSSDPCHLMYMYVGPGEAGVHFHVTWTTGLGVRMIFRLGKQKLSKNNQDNQI